MRGGTLHSATAGEWRNASYANRLATAGDWAAAALRRQGKVASDIAELRTRAEAIQTCVSEAAQAGADNLKASELAAACLIISGAP